MRTTLCLGFVVVVVALGLAGCESPADARRTALRPNVSDRAIPASEADLSAGQLRQAATLYAAKCARCHKFYDPTAYSEAEWRLWMEKMCQF